MPTHEQTLARTIATSQVLSSAAVLLNAGLTGLQSIKQRMIAIRTGTPYRQNILQKMVKAYMVLCESDAQITGKPVQSTIRA
jgi:hypothetical protein